MSASATAGRKPGSSGRARVAAPPQGAPPSAGRTPRVRRALATDTDGLSARRSREDASSALAAVTEEGEQVERKLLHVQSDSTSDSSASPRSDGEGCQPSQRPDSKDSSESSDGSIAVDCATSPAEVIVQGKNVKKIRVKFPHPPKQNECRDSAKSRTTRLTQTQSTMEFHQVHPKSEDGIPLSQEESTSPSDSSTWSIPPISSSSFGNSQLLSDSGIQSVRMSRDYSLPNLNALNQGMDMDGKFKQDILHGLEYFDQRNGELKKMNKKLLRDLERMTEANGHLEDHIEQLNKKFALLSDENDELKIKMDQLEKENMRFQEQAMSEWTSRVKLEEMYMEVKRESGEEIKSLKERVEEQNRELRNTRKESVLKDAIGQKKEKQRDEKLAGDTLELSHKITHLQEEIKRLNSEKDLGKESQHRLQDEMKDLRELHKQKIAELEAQYKRFLSLKKSFNDLMEENEKLKKQMRGRKDGMGNSTWPSNKTNTLAAEVETVHFIDLPSQKPQVKTAAGAPYKHCPFQKGTPLLKAPSPAVRGKVMGHTRVRSEGMYLPENLPPVSSPAK